MKTPALWLLLRIAVPGFPVGSMKSGPRRFSLAVSGLARLLPLLVLLHTGCKSGSESAGGPNSPRLAAVVIKGHSVADVTLAAQRVFIENGYERAPSKTAVKTADLVFDKQGTSVNTLVYGDWSGKPVWVRIKVYASELTSPDAVLLDCDVFRVLERGDPHFEEEHKLTRLHRGPYQELLDKVSHLVQKLPSTASTVDSKSQ